LIQKFCQFRQEPNYVGTDGHGSDLGVSLTVGIRFHRFVIPQQKGCVSGAGTAETI
jgi:hypothetical protein